MTDWNRDGHTDAADIATEYAAYRAIMGEDSKPRTPKQSTSANTNRSGAGAAWAIIAAAIIGILIAAAR